MPFESVPRGPSDPSARLRETAVAGTHADVGWDSSGRGSRFSPDCEPFLPFRKDPSLPHDGEVQAIEPLQDVFSKSPDLAAGWWIAAQEAVTHPQRAERKRPRAFQLPVSKARDLETPAPYVDQRAVTYG